MSGFHRIYERLMKTEGGYVKDRGGHTFKGISERFLRGIGDDRDPRDLSDDERFILYRDHFWNPIKGGLINSEPTAECIFDFAVNSGVPRAVRVAQICINTEISMRIFPTELALPDHLVVDGIMGGKTLTAINNYWLFLPCYKAARLAYLKTLSNWERNKNGWTKRVNGL